MPRVLAVALACLLGTVLPRLLVVCTHADGVGWLELAHAPGTCHHDEHASAPAHDGAATTDPPTPLAAPRHGCEHTSVAIEILPAPRPAHNGIVLPAPAIAWAGPAAFTNAEPDPLGLHPPPTGPPRTDQRTGLRRFTLLLI